MPRPGDNRGIRLWADLNDLTRDGQIVTTSRYATGTGRLLPGSWVTVEGDSDTTLEAQVVAVVGRAVTLKADLTTLKTLAKRSQTRVQVFGDPIQLPPFGPARPSARQSFASAERAIAA